MLLGCDVGTVKVDFAYIIIQSWLDAIIILTTSTNDLMPFGGGLVVEPRVAQVHWLRACAASSWFLWWVGGSGEGEGTGGRGQAYVWIWQ
jgi:hypothetical protein